MRVIASVEARMGSSRLPGKVLLDIAGRPALARLFDRLKACQQLDDIILATTTSERDDDLVDWAKSEGLAIFRGSEEDVLDRVVSAQRLMGSDVVVEITGDCPLIDPVVVDHAVLTYHANDCDVVTNARLPSFPQGVDVQVYSFKSLEEVSIKITDSAVREHVSLYFYENPDKYRIFHLLAYPHHRHPSLRLQVDYPEDLLLVRSIYERLLPKYGPTFGLDKILELLEADKELARINAHCTEKPVR